MIRAGGQFADQTKNVSEECMTHVIRNYQRVSKNTVERYKELPAATVYEAAGQQGMLDPRIHAVYPDAKVCGRAVTVQCHVGDNLMIHKAVTVAGPGDVLVVSIRNDANSGAWGEILTTAAQARGIAGLIIDGAVRDAEATRRRDFPIFSRGLAVGATMKKNLGLINHPLGIGGVFVNPGDLIVGDIDGVVVVPRAEAEQILEASMKREEREAVLMDKLAQGVTTLELLGLNEILEDLGLVEE